MWKWKKMTEQEKKKRAEEDFVRLLPKMKKMSIRVALDDFEEVTRKSLKKDEIILEKDEKRYCNRKKYKGPKR